MADNQNNEDKPAIPSGSKYKGKPENFKPDFKHPNAGKKPAGKPGPKSGTLPPPSNTAGKNNPTPTRDEAIYKEAVFGPEIVVRENNMRTTVQPNFIGLIPLVNDMWLEMRVDETQIDKQMTIEGIRYYATVLLWIRMISLKRANNILLTDNEQQLLDMVESTTFNIPEPVYLYLKAVGTIQTTSTGQTLIPTFPELPHQILHEHGGYYGAINEENHNLYEEIPCMGVCSEAVRQSLSDAGPGRYASQLDTPDVQVNSNLLGFENLTNRRPEAKNFFLNLGITDALFAESVPGTGFNYDVVYAISQWLSTTKTFKNQAVNFSTLGMNGSQAQTIIQRPIVTGALANTRNIMSEARETSLSKASTTTFGLGYYCSFQLYKESAINATQNESMRARTWCCQNYDGNNAQTTIPNAYIHNRNERRNLPIEYTSERFETISMRMGDLRKRTIHHLVVAKR